MSEKPILFSGEMVRAILDGRKTMTRRVAKPQPVQVGDNLFDWDKGKVGVTFDKTWWDAKGKSPLTEHAPYQVGQRLWVRETWYYDSHMHELTDGEPDAPDGRYLHRLVYRATSPDWQVYGGWKPSIFMPRWACRLELEVTAVRVERLQDISEEDAIAEGFVAKDVRIAPHMTRAYHARDGFVALWDSLNEKRGYGWAQNPWVWVVEFEKAQS